MTVQKREEVACSHWLSHLIVSVSVQDVTQSDSLLYESIVDLEKNLLLLSLSFRLETSTAASEARDTDVAKELGSIDLVVAFQVERRDELSIN